MNVMWAFITENIGTIGISAVLAALIITIVVYK